MCAADWTLHQPLPDSIQNVTFCITVDLMQNSELIPRKHTLGTPVTPMMSMNGQLKSLTLASQARSVDTF